MHNKIKKLFSKTAPIQAAFVVLFLLYTTSDSTAVDWDKFLDYNPQKITPAEYQALPDYCQTKLYYHHLRGEEGRKSKTKQKWQQVFGSDYNHLHHYCWGLVNMARAKKLPLDNKKRPFVLKNAIGNLDYVIKKAASDSRFLWMYHQKKGEALLMQYKFSEAQIEFRKAQIYKKRSSKK